MSLQIAKSVGRNTSVMFGSQIITWLSSFVLMLFLPRYLGSEEYGRLFLAINVAMISQVLIDFGGAYYIPKVVARDTSITPVVFVNSVALRSLLWVVSLAGVLVFAALSGYPSEVKFLIFIFAIAKLWDGALMVLQRCFQGHESMKYLAAGNVVEKLFVAITAIIALLLGANAVVVAVLMVASTFLNFTVCVRSIRKIIPYFPKFTVADVTRIARESTPYFLWALSSVIYYRIDAVMLSFMSTPKVLGWYGAAYRFFDIVMFFPSIFTSAIFPIFSKLWSAGDDTLSKTTQKSLDVMFLGGIPVSIFIFAFSEQVIQIFLGSRDYAPSVGLLKIFSTGLLLVYVNFILTSVIVASDRQRDWFKIAFLAMLFNPALNYFLIPYFERQSGNGAAGAALATLITEYFLLVTGVFLVPKKVFANSKVNVILKAIASGAVTALVLWLAFALGVHWIGRAILGCAVYVGMILLLKTFDPPELAFIKTMVNPRNFGRDLAVGTDA